MLKYLVVHFFFIASFGTVALAYWFPSRFWFSDTQVRHNIITKGWEPIVDIPTMIVGFAFVALFALQFFAIELSRGTILTDIALFNSIDNFYEPAACGQTRALKSGLLLRAQTGEVRTLSLVSPS